MTTMDHAAIRADYHQSLISEALDLLATPEMQDLEPALREGLRNYLVHRVETGGFLRRCLENDFAGAVVRAHPHLYLIQLKLIALLLVGGFPAMAWGSAEKVAAWLDKDAGDGGQEDAGN